jgi:hypothetical protein
MHWIVELVGRAEIALTIEDAPENGGQRRQVVILGHFLQTLLREFGATLIAAHANDEDPEERTEFHSGPQVGLDTDPAAKGVGGTLDNRGVDSVQTAERCRVGFP